MPLVKSRFVDMLPLVLFVMICGQAIMQFVFVRYVHYHAQNRVLNPADYSADVLPAASADDDSATSFRKSDDGEFVVKVTTLGTAHELSRFTTMLLPILGLGIAGVAASLYKLRQQSKLTAIVA